MGTESPLSPGSQSWFVSLQRWIPILDWGLHYQRQNLVADLTAGPIVASLLIPQSMAYAMLAGLPPQVGLYASILPQVIYACLGTSRMLSVGPVAVDSLMVATAVGALATPDSPEYLQLAIALAVLVGSIELLMGILRLGFLVNFLSQAVISGFISAAAILIGISQLRHVLGIKIPPTESLIPQVRAMINALPTTNLVTVLLGGMSLVILLGFNHWLPQVLQRRGLSPQAIIPLTKSAPLVVVVLGSGLVAAL
jgi:SulP family sulfate permease